MISDDYECDEDDYECREDAQAEQAELMWEQSKDASFDVASKKEAE